MAPIRGGVAKAKLPGKHELLMESFVRAVEIVLKEGELKGAPRYGPELALWKRPDSVKVESIGRATPFRRFKRRLKLHGGDNAYHHGNVR